MFSMIVVRARAHGEVFLVRGRQAMNTLFSVAPASGDRWYRLLLMAAR